MHRGLLTADDLSLALGWVSRHPKSAQIRDFVARADGLRESPGESRLGYLFHLKGLAVTPQFEIAAPETWPRWTSWSTARWSAVEFDGRVKEDRNDDEPGPFGLTMSSQELLFNEKRR